MTSLRLSDEDLLLAAPELADLAILVAVLDVVAASLRAHHALLDSPAPNESSSATAARDLAHSCRYLRHAVLQFRERTIAELRDVADYDPWLDDDEPDGDDIPW